jgi:hypothetical protein
MYTVISPSDYVKEIDTYNELTEFIKKLDGFSFMNEGKSYIELIDGCEELYIVGLTKSELEEIKKLL